MTKEEIIQGYEQIEKFMNHEQGYDENGVWQRPKYHTSWDWLMPVWYKFRDARFELGTTTNLHTNYVARLAQDLAYGNIDEFFHKICIAIEWYNTQIQIT